MNVQLYECTKSHWIVHFKWVSCMIYELSSFYCVSWVVCTFWGIGPFHLSCQIYGCSVVHNVTQLPFDVCRVSSDSPHFIADISNLCHLPPPPHLFGNLCHLPFSPCLAIFLRFMNFIDLYRELGFYFMNFLLLFCFQFHWFLLLYSLFLSFCTFWIYLLFFSSFLWVGA